MESLKQLYKVGKFTTEEEPVFSKDGLFDLPINSIVKYKMHTLKVTKALKKYSCEGCIIKEYFVNASGIVCAGMECLKQCRRDREHIILKFTKEKQKSSFSGVSQQTLSLF